MLSDQERQETRRALKVAASGGQASESVRLARTLLQSGKAADTMFCASAFAGIADTLVKEAGCRRLKTYIVRSVTVEPILPFLSVEAVLAGFMLDLEVGGYGSYMEELLAPRSALGRSSADVVFVLLDLEDICGGLPELCADGRGEGVDAEIEESVKRVGQMLRSYRRHHAGKLLLQGFVIPDRTSLGDAGDANTQYSLPNAVRDLNLRLAVLCGTISDCIFFDIDQLAARSGRSNWRDIRLFFASRLPIASSSFEAFARSIIRTVSVLFRAPRKVLCTDLDNTLWGGVLGEEGSSGIATGSAYPGVCYLEYQKYLKRLAKRGILLAAVSKNNLADVEEAFDLRADDLALRLDDFVACKIGWNEKSDALRELAGELSLGLDSFVFVDDSPVECEAIRQLLPEVAVVTAPIKEPWKLVGMLSEAWYFDTAIVTADDLNRSQEYKAQAERATLGHGASSRDEFLLSLRIVCTFVSALDAPLARSVQLLAKTNQFNLTTRRHSATEVEHFATNKGGQAIAVRVRDRFGDAGVVGLALAQQQGDECRIDSLLLSCRVIGRGIETALLAHLAAHAARMGSRWLIGEYVATRKNAPCARFYAEHGFQVEPSASESVLYRLDLTQHMPATPSWLTLEGEPNA